MSREQIQGRLVFGDDALPFRGASVELILEDTTFADAPAIPVARRVLSSVSYDGGGGSIAFVLHRDPVEPGRHHSLMVLVDLDGDGKLGRGDYRNAESVPVPPGSARDLIVPLRRIR